MGAAWLPLFVYRPLNKPHANLANLPKASRFALAVGFASECFHPVWYVRAIAMNVFVRFLEALVNRVLDPLREAWGAPIIVTSGYRCEELNARVGGAKRSYHLRGMAADIRPQNGDLDKLYLLIGRMFVTGKMGITECYIDRTKGYIHIAYDASEFNAWPFLTT